MNIQPKYQKELQSIKRHHFITTVISAVAFVIVTISIISYLLYCFDAGQAKNDYYKNNKMCIFKSNCK